jgi:hypothetical protein
MTCSFQEAKMQRHLGIRPRGNHIWTGAAAGLIGGLAGSWVMEKFQAAWSRGMGPSPEPPQQSADDESGDATVRTAEAISERILGRPLTDVEKRRAGPVVHYAFGAATGALYGVVAEMQPAAAKGYGLPFGAAVWLGADEVAVPAFGLSKPPNEYPPSVHTYALASHLVYGLTTEVVRRAVRTMSSRRS